MNDQIGNSTIKVWLDSGKFVKKNLIAESLLKSSIARLVASPHEQRHHTSPALARLCPKTYRYWCGL